MIDWGAIRFVARFALHILLGAVIFAFVAEVAIYLHVVMDEILDGTHAVAFVSQAIEGVELFIFSADLICVVAFVVKETLMLLRSLWLDIRDPEQTAAKEVK